MKLGLKTKKRTTDNYIEIKKEHKEYENDTELIVNNIKYGINKNIFKFQCPVLGDLIDNEFVDEKEKEINISEGRDLEIKIFLDLIHNTNFHSIGKMNVRNLIGLSKIIDRYPIKNLTIYELEPFLCDSFEQCYREVYLTLCERYNLKDLIKLLF